MLSGCVHVIMSYLINVLLLIDIVFNKIMHLSCINYNNNNNNNNNNNPYCKYNLMDVLYKFDCQVRK